MIKYMKQGAVKPRPMDETAWREIPEETAFSHKMDCVLAYLLGIAGGMIVIFSLLF